MDILYLDDYINLYSKKHHKIIKIIPYKNTLKNGHIIDKEKFIKKMSKFLDEYQINKNIFNNTISIIINNSYSLIDKEVLKEVFELLYYKKINFVQEVNYLDIDKNKLFINYNNSYFYLYSINKNGNIQINIYDNNEINNFLISKIIKLYNKNKVYVFGKNYLKIIKILDENKINYYYFEDSENLFINLLIKNM